MNETDNITQQQALRMLGILQQIFHYRDELGVWTYSGRTCGELCDTVGDLLKEIGQ